MSVENRDPAAERAVLAGIARYGQNGYMETADIVQRSSFTLEPNQILYHIFESIIKAGSQTVDVASVLSTANILGHKDFFKTDSNKVLLRSILNLEIDQGNLRILAARVRKLEVARLLRAELKQADREIEQVTGEEPIEAIVGLAEKRIFNFGVNLGGSSSEEPVPINAGFEEYKEYLLANRGRPIGIPTGFPQYDLAIGGGVRPGINVTGGRLKSGKSTLGNTVVAHVAGKLRVETLYLDTEMSKEEQQIRLAANLSNIPVNTIEAGLFYDKAEHKERFDKAQQIIKDMPYSRINIFGKTVESVTSIIRRWLMKKVGFEDNGYAKPCLVILDYIKLLDQATVTKNIAEHQALGFLVSGLHDFAKQYNVPFYAFAQLNRDGINQEDSGAFSGSDRVGWFASNLAIFKKKSQEEIAEEAAIHSEFYNRKLIVTDARHGAGTEAGDYINMKFEGQFARVTEGKLRSDVYANQKPKGTVVEGAEAAKKRADEDSDFGF